MSLEMFLIVLLAVSVMTGLFTEAIKKTLDEMGWSYKSNLLAGCVAVILTCLVASGYMILTETMLNEKMAVYLIALVLLSWLCAMLGYDKVIQAIIQIRNGQAEKSIGEKEKRK